MTPSHDSFTLTRDLRGSRANAWAAWADPTLKRKWFVDSDGPLWIDHGHALDFRVGGVETGAFELTDGPGKGLHENVSHYLDIAPEERIVYAYSMAMNGKIHSCSLSTVTFADQDGGTRLTYTEHGVFYDTSDGVARRRGGWDHLLTALDAYLSEKA